MIVFPCCYEYKIQYSSKWSALPTIFANIFDKFVNKPEFSQFVFFILKSKFKGLVYPHDRIRYIWSTKINRTSTEFQLETLIVNKTLLWLACWHRQTSFLNKNRRKNKKTAHSSHSTSGRQTAVLYFLSSHLPVWRSRQTLSWNIKSQLLRYSHSNPLMCEYRREIFINLFLENKVLNYKGQSIKMGDIKGTKISRFEW